MTATIDAVYPVLMSRNLGRTIQFYQELGFSLLGMDDADDPRYARLSRDNVELHFQWHDAAEWEFPNDRPTYRFFVEDVDGLFDEFASKSDALDITPVFDSSWGTREFHLRDPDLNGLQFFRSL
jgi:hypothetical protein